ncbi:peroxisomal membrane protein PEX14 [Venturia canescens]|uniref:peroxisomal membrane protein PEX14 n=1 Tax=Venturia canescens TaxID=32260 RepID=UPI001C9BF83B|nr:peroxisomal membrane protein PEX14 [Venturia canescens]
MAEHEVKDNNLLDREKLVDTAVKFLKNPKVSNSPLKTKQEFLRRKGLTEEEITRACELAGSFVKNDHNLLSLPNEHTSIPMPQSQIYPYYHQQVFQPTLFTKIKDAFNVAALVGTTIYCVYWFYKRFIEPFFFERKKKDTIQDSVTELDKTIQNTMKEMKQSITQIEASVKQVSQRQSADSCIPILVQELKQDLASLKGLLLARKQFPSAPQSIPAWQLDTSSQSHQGKSTEREDDAGSGSSTNNSDSSLEMIREDRPKE